MSTCQSIFIKSSVSLTLIKPAGGPRVPQETLQLPVDILDAPHLVIEGHLELDDEPGLKGSVIHIIQLEGEENPLVIREVILNSEIDQAKEGNMVLMHGLTQLSDAGPSAALQEHLALAHPNRRVLAIESDGMGEFSQGLSLKDLRGFTDYTLERMAERRLQFLKQLQGPSTLIGTSMGTILIAKLLRAAERNNDYLELDSIVFNDSAVVVEERQAKMRGFLPHLLIAAGLEFARMPKDRLGHAFRQGKHALGAVGAKDGLAMARQIYDLYFGEHPTSKDLHAIARCLQDQRTQFLFISGDTDPLRTPKIYKALKEAFPDQVHVRRVPFASHARSIDPVRVEYDISKGLGDYVERYTPHVHAA